MNLLTGRWVAVAVLATLTACGTATREPAPAGGPRGTAGEATTMSASGATADRAQPSHTAADVRFMQHMIPHHAQALKMTELVPDRTDRADLRLLAERIEVSQQDEIAMMQQWLREHGEEAPAVAAGHAHHGAGGDPVLMPGMLTAEEMARLAAATGGEFDRLFLESMIRHHEGALVMVAGLFATEGAGQEPDVFRLASDVDADQRMEIERMRRLLEALPSGAHHP